MIQWLKTVIGMAINSIRLAMPALQDQGILSGGNSNIAEDIQPQSQSAKWKLKHKPKAAQSTKQVSSRKPKQKAVQAESGETGKQQVAPASKTRQPAKSVKTQKQKVAALTTQAKKRTLSKTTAQTHTVRQSKANGS